MNFWYQASWQGRDNQVELDVLVFKNNLLPGGQVCVVFCIKGMDAPVQ